MDDKMQVDIAHLHQRSHHVRHPAALSQRVNSSQRSKTSGDEKEIGNAITNPYPTHMPKELPERPKRFPWHPLVLTCWIFWHRSDIPTATAWYHAKPSWNPKTQCTPWGASPATSQYPNEKKPTVKLCQVALISLGVIDSDLRQLRM